MRRAKQLRAKERSARFESFEEKLALSAQAIASLIAEDLGMNAELHFGELTPAPSEGQDFSLTMHDFESPVPVHHTTPPMLTPHLDETFEHHQAGDFLLESLLPVDPHDQEVFTTLADVHDVTGVNYVHNTYGFRGEGQTIAVIDSGIAYDHYSLGAGFGAGHKVVGGYDFTEENDANPYDDGPSGFHGTHVAGIIGSDHATYKGVASGADLVALRVFNDNGDGYFSWVENALQWVHDNRTAFEHEITTVNLSLGTTWNSDSIPGWAMLEDEFAQLEADGIFISVSAGNSFTDYNSPGLSYPAASPYVVPVASIDNDGSLSYFSQRHDRVLAAPGRSITSTVPDHVFGEDGIPNDFGSASGTSMAAPYVAGASALVRQAMEFVGMSNITQDAIYDHLRDTADLVYDAATNANYHNINVQAALDALMPADDYGSTAQAAHTLGTLSGTSEISGLISTVNDTDFFTFTSGVTGTATFAADCSYQLASDWSLVGGGATIDGDTISFDVVAGQSYTISLGTNDGLGYYDISANLESTFVADDLGSIAYSMMETINNQGNWYEITATRSGLLTAEALFSHSGGNVDLEVYDSNMNLLGASSSVTNNERVDVGVSGGTSYYINLAGANADVDLRLSNNVSVSGGTVTVFGTAAADTIAVNIPANTLTINGVQHYNASLHTSTITIDATGGDDTLTIDASSGNDTVTVNNGVVDATNGSYSLHATSIETATIHGGGGTDTLRAYGGASADTLTLRPGTLELSTGTMQLDAASMELIYAYSGGGQDTAYMYDSAGNDEFYGWSQYSMMRGAGYYNYASGFATVRAEAESGGRDVARLYDSIGNDEYTSKSEYAELRGSGFANRATGFDLAYAYANAGGLDSARLYDSTGNDTFVASPSNAQMFGDGFSNSASGFESVYGYATAGGNDKARFFDSTANDQFYGWSQYSMMRGSGFYNYASGFDTVEAHSSQGNDAARLYDSAGNDQFFASPHFAELKGASFANSAAGFKQVYAYATAGGHDTARLNDSIGNDTLYASPSFANLCGAGFSNSATGFDSVSAFASQGSDSATLVDSAGDDAFYAWSNYAVLRGATFNNYVNGFDSVSALAVSGGNDWARLYDSVGNDEYYGWSGSSLMRGLGFSNYARGFDVVLAYSQNGGADTARLYDSVGDDLFTARSNFSQMSGAGFLNMASGFRTVYGYANSGGTDRATFQNVSESDHVGGTGNLASFRTETQNRWLWNFDRVTAVAATQSTPSADMEAVDYLFDQIGNWT